MLCLAPAVCVVRACLSMQQCRPLSQQRSSASLSLTLCLTLLPLALLCFVRLQDVAHEATKWGGRVLLHQELFNPSSEATRRASGILGSTGTGGQPAGLTINIPSRGAAAAQLPLPIVGSFLTPPVGPVPPAAVQLSAALAPVAFAATKHNSNQLPAASPVPAAAAAAADGGFPGFRPISPGSAVAASPAAYRANSGGSSSQILIGPEGAAVASNTAGDDVTAPVDVRPGAAVVPYWEPVALGGGAADGQAAANAAATGSGGSGIKTAPLATCLDIAKQLQAAGFHVTYRRIPLSRERTPVPSDLSDMMKQMLALPAGVGPLDAASPAGGASPKAAQMMKDAAQWVASGTSTAWMSNISPAGAAAAAADGNGSAVPAAEAMEQQQPGEHRSIVHLVVSRTATGSSARFVTAAFATFLTKHSKMESNAAAAGAPTSPTKAGGGSPGGNGQGPAKRMKRTHSDLGEYRGIMSVARLLPGGLEVKGAVDEAIDRCAAVGNLREDIKACKHNAEAAPVQISEDPGSMAWAARQLGVHYLKRYFLLIAFRWVLLGWIGLGANEQGGCNTNITE